MTSSALINMIASVLKSASAARRSCPGQSVTLNILELNTTRGLFVRGQSLEVRWWGPSNADTPACVLLHEGLGSVTTWRDFPRALAERTGCRVMAYSRLGHGASDLPARARTPRFMHDEAIEMLPAVLDAAGLHAPYLLGHSDGASIALIFAATYPDRTPGLVLEAPHVFVEDVSIESVERMKIKFETTAWRARLARHHDHVDAAFRGWNDAWLDPAFRDWNIEEYLARVTCPVLVIQGEDDEYGTVRQVDAIAAQVRGPVQTLVLPGVGHTPHKDQPDTVLDSIARFIAPPAA